MTQAPVAAEQALGSTYRASKTPPFPGQTRVMRWALVLPTENDDPVWAARAAEYWQRQERLYGYVVHDTIINLVSPDGTFIASYAVVDRVLPGERTLSASTN